MPHKKSKANKTAKKSMLAQRQKSMRTQLRSTNTNQFETLLEKNLLIDLENQEDLLVVLKKVDK